MLTIQLSSGSINSKTVIDKRGLEPLIAMKVQKGRSPPGVVTRRHQNDQRRMTMRTMMS